MEKAAKTGQKELERLAKDADEQTEEVKGVMSLLGDLAKQTYDFGLYLNLVAMWRGCFALPWGLTAAGAAMTRTFVDAGDAKGAAKATALLVKLGFLNLVRDIVVKLSQHDRADVVSQTTVGLLGEGEFKVVSDINNALIEGGYIKEATAVGAVMGKQVTGGFFEGLKEAGANLLPGIWGKGDDDSQDAKSKPRKGEQGQEGGHSQESDHGLSDMGIDNETSVLQESKAGLPGLLGSA